MYADDFLQGLMVMGIIILLIGLVVAIGSAIGAGLMTMGVGLVISGIGGTIYFKTPSILIGGSSGVVLILVGAFFDHFTSSTGV